MIIAIICLIAVAIIIGLTILKNIKPNAVKIIYLILIGVSILSTWIITAEFLDYTDTSSGFRTASSGSGRWFIFAIPAFIIILLTEGLTKIINIERNAAYNRRPEVKEARERADRIFKMSDEEFKKYIEEENERIKKIKEEQ